MPLISTVLNYLRGETSSKKEDDSEGDEKDVRVNKYDSPSKSPRLLQKLNEIQASLMENRCNLEKTEIRKSKKRVREHSFDEDDEVVTRHSQKRRRVYSFTRDYVGNSAWLADEAKCSNAVETYSPRKKNVADCDVICLDDIDKPTEHQEGNSLEDDVIICEPDCTETEKRIGISSGNSYFKKQWGQPKVVDDEVSTRENRFQIVPESTSTGTKNKLVQTGPTMGNKGTGNNCPHELPSACAGNELEQNGMNIDVNTTECEQKGEEMSDSMCENREVEQTVEEKEFDVNVARNENEFASSSTCQRKELEENKIQDNLIAQQISEGILTDSMLDQEKKLHQKHLEEEKEIVTKAMEEWEFTIEQQRYTRLQHLLEKSNIYSSFLLQRIEKQKEEKEKERQKHAKKIKKAEEETPQTVVTTKRGRKRKGMSTSYNITDYVDHEALKQSNQSPDSGSLNRESRKEFSVGQSKNADDSKNENDSYKQPRLLTGGSLRDYQIDGVEWLKVLYENGVNGILADEMGLGKTVQCIALLAHLIEMGVRGPFLVTAPLSTLPNWVSEFKRFTPSISVVLYHGSPDERTRLRRKIPKLQGDEIYKAYPVVITSYEIVMRDRKFLEKHIWKYVIVDEGHRIKNLKCRLIRELKAYPSANRLLLTGTPLQNNLSELWSLLNFLLPDIFDDLDSFQAWFDFSAISESGGNQKIITQEREHHVLERLHAILTPFLLRRLKTDVNIDLPRKKEVLVYAPLTQKQEYWYKLFLDKTRLHNKYKNKSSETPSLSQSGRALRRCSRKVNYEIFDSDSLDYEELIEALREDEDRKKKITESSVSTPQTCERNVKLLNVIMQLRKTCNHPYLLEYPLIPETQEYRIDEELIACCGKTLVLDQMLTALKERGHKVLLFSQMTKMLDILEDFCYLRKYKFSRIDGSMNFEDRQTQIEDFNSDPNVLLFLLSTRAGGLGLNLTAADTVILYDSDWNPQQDLQAQDRCHRIGQTKPVVVYRILTSNTVDQRIVERAADKRKLEKMIIHKGKFKGVRDGKKLTASEMQELLESSDHKDVVNTDNNGNTQVLTKEQLKKLLDRSDLLGDNTVTSASNQSEEESKIFKVIEIAQ